MLHAFLSIAEFISFESLGKEEERVCENDKSIFVLFAIFAVG